MIVSPPRGIYRKTYVGRVALTLVFVFIAAVFFFAFAEKGRTASIVAAAAVMAVDTILVTLMGKGSLSIHDEGLRRTSIFGTKEIEWKNVKEYRYRPIPIQVGGLVGSLIIGAMNRAGGRRATTSLFLTVIADSGTRIKVTSGFKDAYDAIGAILAKIHDQIRPRVLSELSAGARFGPVLLSTRQLRWKSKEPVLLSDLAFAEIRGQKLNIKKSGKMFSIVSVRSDTVPNVLLLLEEMERLGVGRNRIATVDPLARVQP